MEFGRGLHWGNAVVDIGSAPKGREHHPIEWTEREKSHKYLMTTWHT